ncbi:hypothetical protein FRC01_013286, partial [Tulasnella sp. 417]
MAGDAASGEKTRYLSQSHYRSLPRNGLCPAATVVSGFAQAGKVAVLSVVCAAPVGDVAGVASGAAGPAAAAQTRSYNCVIVGTQEGCCLIGESCDQDSFGEPDSTATPGPEVSSVEIPGPEVSSVEIPGPEVSSVEIPGPEVSTVGMPGPEETTAEVQQAASPTSLASPATATALAAAAANANRSASMTPASTSSSSAVAVTFREGYVTFLMTSVLFALGHTLEMRSTLLYTLFGLAATSMAVPSGVELGVELLPKLIPKTQKRKASVIEGLQSRKIGGGFIAVMSKDGSILAEGDDGQPGRRRRFLRKDEAGKIAVLSVACAAPTGDVAGVASGAAGSTAAAQTRSHNCVNVGVQQDCCPIGKSCSPIIGNGCAKSGYVPCDTDNFCCRPGYTCYRDSVGTRLCSPPSTYNDTTTIAGVQEATDFAFSTTAPTPATAAANTTGSASGTGAPSSSLDIPVVASNGAVAITFREGYVTFLMALVLFALDHAF